MTHPTTDPSHHDHSHHHPPPPPRPPPSPPATTHIHACGFTTSATSVQPLDPVALITTPSPPPSWQPSVQPLEYVSVTCGPHHPKRILLRLCHITLQPALCCLQLSLQQVDLSLQCSRISGAGLLGSMQAGHCAQEGAVGATAEPTGGAGNVWRRRQQVLVGCRGARAQGGSERVCMKEVAGRVAPVGLALDIRQQLQAGSDTCQLQLSPVSSGQLKA